MAQNEGTRRQAGGRIQAVLDDFKNAVNADTVLTNAEKTEILIAVDRGSDRLGIHLSSSAQLYQDQVRLDLVRLFSAED
ncbi:hypothetical protein RI367_006207 [Sorochytrium milnesiophthora]